MGVATLSYSAPSWDGGKCQDENSSRCLCAAFCAIYVNFNLFVDKQHDNRANNGNHEAAKIEAIDFTSFQNS